MPDSKGAQSAHEELVERGRKVLLSIPEPMGLSERHREAIVRLILDEAFRTLETWGRAGETVYDEEQFIAMLRASPLNPENGR